MNRLLLWVGALLYLPAAAQAQSLRSASTQPSVSERLFWDLSKTQVGTLSTQQERKRYLTTIQAEKGRITQSSLDIIYENAMDLYRRGEYEEAAELSGTILSVDPNFRGALALRDAATKLQSGKGTGLSPQSLLEDKFERGLALYRQGRLVEAARLFEETVQLDPWNLKARDWLRRTHYQIAERRTLRGQALYAQGKIEEALQMWYGAVVLNPQFPGLRGQITLAESALRDRETGESLAQALGHYNRKEHEKALQSLSEALQMDPANLRAQRLTQEIRREMGVKYLQEGQKLYRQEKLNSAIHQFQKARPYGLEQEADLWIARSRGKIQQLKKARAEMARVERKRKEKEKEQPSAAQAQAPESAAPSAVLPTEEAKRMANKHYFSGVIYFQKGDYEHARNEWQIANQLDPAHEDAHIGLQRIQGILGP
ncbi:MAG: tetratricopeptide repeat protein [Elusimicrobia bacterium]|nr:tetratricopeptide repeat protein [Elusimicrobiota bacterium]